MKTKILTILLCLISLTALSNGIKEENKSDVDSNKISKKKTINANFELSDDYKLFLNGIYSDIKVASWDENYASFHIEIYAQAKNSNDVDKIIQAISIDFDNNKTAKRLNVTTNVENIKMRTMQLNIEYYIMIPKNTTFNVKNSYGDLFIGNLHKKTELDVMFGNITIDTLYEGGNISTAYTNVSIGHTGKLNASIKYGDLNINTADNIEMSLLYSDCDLEKANKISGDIKYGDLNIGEAGDLKLSILYGDSKIGKLGNFSGDIKYGDLIINSISDNISISNTTYSDIKIYNTANDFGTIDIDASYTDVMILLNEEQSYCFDIELSYGGFSSSLLRNSSRIFYQEKDSSLTVSGNYNNNKDESSNKIIIDLLYGNFSTEN